MKFLGKVGNGPVKKNFGGDPDHHSDTGLVYRIRHYPQTRKVVNEHKSTAASSHSFILIRQMAAVVIAIPVRHGLAEVCTVPVLLVSVCCSHMGLRKVFVWIRILILVSCIPHARGLRNDL